MITPDEYQALRRQNVENKADKIQQFAQDNLEKYINGIDDLLKTRAKKDFKSPVILIDAYLQDDSDYSYALADAIAKEYSRHGWFIYDNTPNYTMYIKMRFSTKRLWWRWAWAKPSV